jgi:tRNA1(Val) A37 N6-methylase TrmN6
MKVINDLLGFNKKIVQDTSYFSFSLDSVLLYNFCKVKKSTKMIDICSGNCPIPLMLSTKIDEKIYAVEVQKEIYDLAVESIKLNDLEDKIEVINMDAKDLCNKFETDTFDLITCNPPYFKTNEQSKKNDNEIKSIARHEILINIEDIIKISRKLLKNNGNLVMVHRPERLSEIIILMNKYNLEVKRLQFIYSKEDSESNMIIIEASKNGKEGMKIMPPIIVHDKDGNYNKEIEKIFRGD